MATQYSVKLIPQVGPDSCWLACYQMIEAWYNSLPAIKTPKHLLTGKQYQAIGNTRNITIQPTEAAVSTMLGSLKLTEVGRKTGKAEVADLLRTYGPLWYGGLLTGYDGRTTGGHVVVITGIDQQDIYLNDPSPINQGARTRLPVADFFNGLSALTSPAQFGVLLK